MQSLLPRWRAASGADAAPPHWRPRSAGVARHRIDGPGSSVSWPIPPHLCTRRRDLLIRPPHGLMMPIIVVGSPVFGSMVDTVPDQRPLPLTVMLAQPGDSPSQVPTSLTWA